MRLLHVSARDNSLLPGAVATSLVRPSVRHQNNNNNQSLDWNHDDAEPDTGSPERQGEKDFCN